MHDILINKIDFIDPWNVDFNARLKLLTAATRRISYYSEAANCSSFRYRVFNMVESINSEVKDGFSASYFFESDSGSFDQIIRNTDLLIIHRTRMSFFVDGLISLARRKGIPILFDTDDLIFNPKLIFLLMNTLNQSTKSSAELDYWFAYTSRISEVLQKCDGVLVTNDFLSNQIKNTFNIKSVSINNFMNLEQELYSKEIVTAKRKSFFSRNMQYLGYFSGSPSHQFDLNLIASAINNIFQKHENVFLVLVGYIEIPDILKKYSHRIIYIPFTDYVNLQRIIASVNINLVPLQTNIFTSCKSNLKYFEASFVETLTIASDTLPYSDSIVSGLDGFLCKSYEWSDAIDSYLNENPKIQRNIVSNALYKAQESFSFYNQRAGIVSALEKFMR
jgi:hypothetical protein